MLILTVVFSTIFRFEGIGNYPTYFLSAYLVFGFFAQTTNQSMAVPGLERGAHETGPGAQVDLCRFDHLVGAGQPRVSPISRSF